jgi:hypothetical protein
LHLTEVVLAVGSFGQILRSEDNGLTWNAVRSSNFRSGVLNLVTNADQASWQLLATTAAEQGVRSVTVQMSQQLRTSNQDGREHIRKIPTLLLTQFAGNEARPTGCFRELVPNIIARSRN